MKNAQRFRVAAVAAAAVATLGLSGCAGSSESADEGTSAGPVTLEYWSWATNVDQVVEGWNQEHPDIQVKVVEAAGADDMVAKLLASVRAGEGPDMAQAEFQKLPSLVVSDVALDLSTYADQFSGEYSKGTMSLVTVGDGVFAVPQDVAPMVFMYRRDLFEQYGLQVPTTWDEYAALAKQVKEVAPTAFLGGYPDDASTFAAYTQPLGATWWSTGGESWNVGIDGPESQRVAKFWQPLVEDGLVDTTHFFTPEWGTKMNDGTLLSWTVGTWGPGAAISVAPDTAGAWAIAPMPSWDGESQVGLMGGSSVMVTKNSDHPQEAVEFLTWLNTSSAGTAGMIEKGGLFPASTLGQEALAEQPVPEIVSGQDDFWEVALTAAKDTAPVTWGPNVQVAFDTWGDAIKQASAARTSYLDVLTATQDAVVADLEKSGFSVD
ncbi:ABC transporter substrate-binding protein [Pengzhenrongella frigida]|nr:extracellular solute-binding protein [Cellulomonas sp. HLT2-17]